MELDSKTIGLTVGLFILLGSIGTIYYVTNPDITYYCNDTNVVGMCFKLSNINEAGIQSRCYYNESTPTKYKICTTGWIKYKEDKVIGEPTNLPTYIEILPFVIQKDFIKKTDAESYITTLKTGKKIDVSILKTEQRPFSSEIEVFWKVRIYEEYNEMDVKCEELECFDVLIIKQNVIAEEILTTKFDENADENMINQTIQINAQEWFSRWQPNIIISK